MTTELDETFAGRRSRPSSVWFPYYLPHWSSRATSAATYEIGGGELRLTIADDQPLWCADRHAEPMRVSCLQTGSYAGPLGSTVGQQPFADGLTVTEEQPTFWGCTPHFGSLAVTMRGTVGPRSMIAFWLSGIEDTPERSGEICVAEIFGDAVVDGVAQVGLGVHRVPRPRPDRGVRHRAVAARRRRGPHVRGGLAPGVAGVQRGRYESCGSSRRRPTIPSS